MTAPELRCPSCAAPFSVEGIDDGRALARCGFCGSVVDLSSRRGAGGGSGTGAPRERPRVALPDIFEVKASSGKGLQVSFRWFTWSKAVIPVAALVWCAVAGYGLTQEGARDNGPIRGILFGLALVCILWFVTTLINRTTITLAMGSLEIRHEPIPWFGGRTLKTADLSQLYAQEVIHRGKKGTRVSYKLQALLKNGRKVTLLRELDDIDQALWLEREIEIRLGIVNEVIGWR